jgi:predicted phage terminase large subunit-like protein
MPVVDAIPVGTRFVRGVGPGGDGKENRQGGSGLDRRRKLGVLPDGRYIIADLVRLRAGPDDVAKALKNTADRDGERRAHQAAAGSRPGRRRTGAGADAAARRLQRGVGAGVSGDKVTRADPLASQVNVGNVCLLEAEWNDALIAEMRMFPNGAHDDQVDALADAFNTLQTGGPAIVASAGTRETIGMRCAGYT